MLQTDFEALFERARRRATRFPRLFRLRVTLRALCGVGFMFALPLGAILLLGWALSPLFSDDASNSALLVSLQVLAAVPALALLLACVRVLRGRFPDPEGIVLPREEAPRLFEMLDRMARRFGAPHIHEVRVTGERNAAITQRPDPRVRVRLRNTLVLGLPMTLALTPRQFVAVLAHEFGHLRHQRIAFGGWGCHVRARWHQLLGNMESVPSWLQPAFATIARFESPAYCAESLVLSHLDEFEADEAAAKVVGATRLGGALAEIALKHRFLSEDYWRKVYAQADHAKQPSFLPYRHMALAFRAGFDREMVADWLDELGGPEEEALGTHPSLRTRVRALGLDETAPVELGAGGRDNAARRFLGEALGRLAGVLDRQWWSSEQRSWRQRHWEVSKALERIARLEGEGARLGVSDRIELAMLVERYGGDRDPVSVYRDMPEASGRPDALLAMGRLLLHRRDPTGASYLRRALVEDDAVGLQAAALLIEHYESTGMEPVARYYRKRLSRLLQQAAWVQEALDEPLYAIRNLTPGLEMFELRSLVRELRRHDPIRCAYVVRRRSEQAPRWRAYLLVLCVPTGAEDVVEPLAREIEAGIAVAGLWRVQVVATDGDEEAMLRNVRGAKIFSRRRSSPADRAVA